MNLKRVVSSLCAAAMLASTALSDIPVWLSGYSHAYAQTSFFSYTYTKTPIVMTVQSNEKGELSCGTSVDIAIPDVTSGETTVAQLRALYSGVTVTGFSMDNSSVDGMTAADLHTSISILSGTDWDGWYAVTDQESLVLKK